jgi:hypothetical protein
MQVLRNVLGKTHKIYIYILALWFHYIVLLKISLITQRLVSTYTEMPK